MMFYKVFRVTVLFITGALGFIFLSLLLTFTIHINSDLTGDEIYEITEDVGLELNLHQESGWILFKVYYTLTLNGELQWQLLETLSSIAQKSKNDLFRQKTVNQLIGAISDKKIEEHALRYLQFFYPTDFKEDALKTLKKLPLDEGESELRIKLMGVANITQRRDELYKFALSSDEKRSWAAKLALARMGDEVMLNQIIEKTLNEQNITTQAQLLTDLGWTKQPQAFNTLRSFLHRQERLPPHWEHGTGERLSKIAATPFVLYLKNQPMESNYIPEDKLPKLVEWADKQTEWVISE